jgi:O-antigen ligase
MANTSNTKKANPFPLDIISTNPSVKNVLFFLVVALAVGVLSGIAPIIAAVTILLLIAIPFTLFFPYEVFLILSFLLLSLGDYFGSKPVSIGGFKFYGADYFLLILLVMIIRTSKTEQMKSRPPLFLLFWIYILYGFISLLFGIFYQGHEINRTIGDFRRFFYYPIAFFLGWAVISNEKCIKKLEKLIHFVPIIIMAFAILRLVMGKTWAPEIHARAEDFRALPYFDGIALIFVFSYLAALFFAKKKLNLLQLIVALPIPIFIVLSGFRLLWVLFILAIMMVLWFSFKQEGKRKYLRILLYLFIIIIISLSLFRVIGGKYYDIFETKIVNKILRYEHTSERWRYPAWKSAISKFKSSPILGTGLGDEPAFWAVNSAGQWTKITRTLHNAFLEILYQTGIIGALLFLSILFMYSLHSYKKFKWVDIEHKPITVALFILFVSGLIQSLFQPYLNHPGNGVIFFSFMGITMKIIQLSKAEHKNHE